MLSATLRPAFVVLLVAAVVKADQDIYIGGALSNGWCVENYLSRNKTDKRSQAELELGY
jgi:hypothetical protein